MSYDPRSLQAWKKLQELASTKNQTLKDYFGADEKRVESLSFEFEDMWLDTSKNHWDLEVVGALSELATQAGLVQKRAAMFEGQAINSTEGRAVLHTALRDPDCKLWVQGHDVKAQVQKELDRVEEFCRKVRSGAWKGHSGQSIKYVVNIGIGGSDLGPKMVVKALSPYLHDDAPKPFFVSNIDGAHLDDALKSIELESTLFIIASKTFTTLETMTNAEYAKKVLLEYFDGDQAAVAKHFVALSTNAQAVEAFGIDLENMFQFWDWVGGRFSMWSVIGLSIAVSLGFGVFKDLLDGAHSMDQHFLNAPFERNYPVLMAMLGIWQNNFLGYESHAVLPYAEHLEYFPAFLQQLDMESNGKTTTVEGKHVDWKTGVIVWGEPGSNGQHAFFQLMHQGTRKISADFILPIRPHHALAEHHLQLVSNCLAQTQALMNGKSLETVEAELSAAGYSPEEIAQMAPHRVFEGNRPSSTLLLKSLTPYTLGQLVALYEHKIFVQGVIWGLNSFDQFGVELGKVLAKGVAADLHSGQISQHQDASTASLLQRILA